MELCSHGELEDLLAEKKYFSEKVDILILIFCENFWDSETNIDKICHTLLKKTFFLSSLTVGKKILEKLK